jgi:hypothetical protein
VSSLDDIRRALTEAYGTGSIFDGITADDLIKALVAESALDAQDYPGELVMLRGLVATLKAVAQHGDLADVRKLIGEYERDEQDARAEVTP